MIINQPVKDPKALSHSSLQSIISEHTSQRSELQTENIEMNSSNELEHSKESSAEFKSIRKRVYGIYENFTKILMFVCIVLIICHIIIAIIYWSEKREIYCETDKCIRSAALLKLSMNLSADPCQDFFKYTCGRWSKEHPLSPTYTRNSKFSDTDIRINVAAQKFLSAEDENNDISSVRQSRMFYRSCLDEGSKKSLGFVTIFEYLKKVDLPIVPSLFTNDSADNDTFNWMRTEAKLKKIFHINALIGVNVWSNRYNASENLIYMGRPETNCYKLGETKMKEKSKKILKYIVNEIIHNVTAEMIPNELTEEAAMIIGNIERTICKESNITFPSKAPFHTSYKFQDLQDEIDRHMSNNANRTEPQFLRSYIGYIFDGIMGVTIDFQQDLLYIRGVKDKPYILDILKFIYTVPETHIEFYLWWIVVVRMARYTYMDQFIKKTEVSRGRLERKNSKRALELICSRDVTSFMYYAVTYGIAEEKFKTSIGQKAKAMVEQLRDELRHIIQTADWLDGKTRSANLEKLDYMHAFIGLPDWLFEKGRLEEYYRQIEINSTTFLRNKLQIMELIGNKNYETLRNGREKFTEFPKNPLIVNAFNMGQINSIFLPLAILTFPIFDFGLDVLNYGSFGTLLGHELTHGFDTIGLKYDKYGNYARWWSKQSESVFVEKTRCFKNQYDDLTLEGIKGHVSGFRTINENIADNGGMSIAYSALKKYENMNSEIQKLPGFENFTREQLFFIAFANLWCYTSTKKEAGYSLKNDVHSPGSVRVNVVLQNSPHFAQVFNCSQDSKIRQA